MRAPPTTTPIMPRNIFTPVTNAPEVDVGARVGLEDVVEEETCVVIDDVGDVWVVVPDDVCVFVVLALLTVTADRSTFRTTII